MPGFGSDCPCGCSSLLAGACALQGLQHLAGELGAGTKEHDFACCLGWVFHLHLPAGSGRWSQAPSPVLGGQLRLARLQPKQKKNRKSENIRPMLLPSLLRTVPKWKCSHELCVERPREIRRDCCCRREGRRSSAAEGGEGHRLSGQVEEHMQLVMWLLLSDGNRTCCNSRLLQVKGFLSVTGKTSELCCLCSQITSGCCY